MLKYIKEAEEDIKMDVQVGPQEEVEAEMEEPKCSAVDMAKKDPETVPVACVEKEGVKEFFVDAKDVAKLADLNEETMIDALDSIIACNEDSGICASNLVVVISEGTELYERNLERNGAACVHYVSESADETLEKDIAMDVQVGPNEEEISVSEDPQEANPVDAVKREYDSVVVAKDDDKFFMDVEDVQKCADLNCESVIDTINGIIGVHEEYDMNTGNVVMLVNENARFDTLKMLEECGVIMLEQMTEEQKGRKSMISKVGKIIKNVFIDSGVTNIKTSTFSIGGQNSKFVNGESDAILVRFKAVEKSYGRTVNNDGGYSVGSKSKDVTNDAAKVFNDNKKKFISAIQKEYPDYKVKGMRIQAGRLGAINISVMFDFSK